MNQLPTPRTPHPKHPERMFQPVPRTSISEITVRPFTCPFNYRYTKPSETRPSPNSPLVPICAERVPLCAAARPPTPRP